MGLKDTAAKNFFGRPEVLACLLEYVLPKVVGNIQEDKLRLVSGEYYRILKNEDGQYITDNLFRDQLFEYDNGREIISIGLEYQSQHDKNMVLRIMGYDLRRYNDLQKEGRMHRIINIVLEFEQDGRTGPCELNQ
ncbi:MAG: Rpn family recombination-promoting nuclease/putative transposase, partial [Victivallales bacterium]|nr:Rpn family recombination-promoting nuclease/putative transposase [Victivallales bacterium]